MLVDVGARGISGKDAEKLLETVGLTVNKNTIPFDTRPPMVASGIRIGTPAVTTRGMGDSPRWRSSAARSRGPSRPGEDAAVQDEVRRTVSGALRRFSAPRVRARRLGWRSSSSILLALFLGPNLSAELRAPHGDPAPAPRTFRCPPAAGAARAARSTGGSSSSWRTRGRRLPRARQGVALYGCPA